MPHEPKAVPATGARIDPSAPEGPDARIGALLRDWRTERHLTLREVADRSQISIGMLSQIERGLSSPSLRVLREICATIGLPMERLFEKSRPGSDDRVVRSHERRSLVLGEKRMRKELLSQRQGSGLQGMIVVIEPGGGSGADLYTHDGEEIGYVLQGSLELTIGSDTYLLDPGDTFCFDSPTPHRFRNPGTTETHVLWVVSRAFY